MTPAKTLSSRTLIVLYLDSYTIHSLFPYLLSQYIFSKMYNQNSYFECSKWYTSSICSVQSFSLVVDISDRPIFVHLSKRTSLYHTLDYVTLNFDPIRSLYKKKQDHELPRMSKNSFLLHQIYKGTKYTS